MSTRPGIVPGETTPTKCAEGKFEANFRIDSVFPGTYSYTHEGKTHSPGGIYGNPNKGAVPKE
jgi:hypothetical protein